MVSLDTFGKPLAPSRLWARDTWAAGECQFDERLIYLLGGVLAELLLGGLGVAVVALLLSPHLHFVRSKGTAVTEKKRNHRYPETTRQKFRKYPPEQVDQALIELALAGGPRCP